jgi:hypothetical protein
VREDDLNIKRVFLGVLVMWASVHRVSAADREGLLLGFSIGSGRLDCLACQKHGAAEIDLRIGRSIGSRWAALASLGGLVSEDEQATFSSYSLTGIGQYWIHNRLWAGGGIGYGENDVDYPLLTVHSGQSLALAAVAGIEIWQRGRFALDLRSRYVRLTKFQTDNFSISAGFTWY